MNYNEKLARLKLMLASTLCGFMAFVGVWIAGCYFADEVIHLPANSWRMAFGFVVGSVGWGLDSFVVSKMRGKDGLFTKREM